MEQTDLFGKRADSTATFSGDREFRYSLTREWDLDLQMVLWVMHNPSVANEDSNDPTMARVLNFSRDFGFGRLAVVNQFGMVSTDPRKLKDHPDPVGPENDRHIIHWAQQADKVIVAWGAGGALLRRDAQILELLQGIPLFCLGKCENGQPRHPLFVPGVTTLELFRAGA